MEQDTRNPRLSLLVVLTILLIAGTVIQDFRFDGGLARTRLDAMSRDRDIGSLQVSLSEFRAAETAYLAAGQGPDFWMRRASDLLAQINGTIERLRASSTSAEAQGRYDAAAAAFADLDRVDQKARAQIQGDQRFTASDIIFVEGLEPAGRAGTELANARNAEASQAEADLIRTTRFRLGLNAAALALLLAALGYATRAGRQKAPVSSAALTAQMIRELPPPVKPAAAAAQRAPAPAAPAPPATNLPEAAELCIDLARVIDGRDIPALLERAARVLEAKGVIVWTVDHGLQALRPTLSHGYSDKVIGKLGTLELDADNVTSLAYRSMKPQTMASATPGGSGAIAVPLVTAAGCTGVLSAETRDGKPATDMVAVARIISAQFATIIAPAESADAARAAEA
jgi:hypothetical protein